MIKAILVIALLAFTSAQTTKKPSLRFLEEAKQTVFDVQSSESFLSNVISNPKLLDSMDNQPHVFSCDERRNKKLNPETEAPFYFLPTLKAKVLANDQTVEWSNGCYENNSAKITKFTKEEIIVSVSHQGRKHWFCKDTYLVSSFDFNFLHWGLYATDTTIVFKNLTQDQFDVIGKNGIKFHGFCQGIKQAIVSLFDTVKLFVGGISSEPNTWISFFSSHIPQYMEDANLRFLEDVGEFKFKKRTTEHKQMPIDKKYIQSGDMFAIRRWDGVDPLIMWGTGSMSGHTTMAMWEDGELYVYESQDGWYWPRHGIQKNTYDYWIEHAINADFEVALLPLREEYRKKFDVSKALARYQQLAGLNYGYRNFLFGWLDTPDMNLPFWVDVDIVASLFTLIERVIPDVVSLIAGEALNLRMGTKGLTIPQLSAVAARKNMTFGDVLAMPEKNEYRYSDGPNFVCSAFVTEMWKAGGIFDDMEIVAAEFGPNDVYHLDIFEKDNTPLPEVCKVADPTLPYCQLTGKYLLELPKYNSIKPYAHMNERCSTMSPTYVRPEGC